MNRFLLPFLLLAAVVFAADPVELASRFKQLPTVPEAELPEMPNERGEFPGVIEHEGLAGHTWVRFPFLENPGSFGFDRKGRVFVAEANRLWLGVPDLRGANEIIRDDFQARSVADRAKIYEKFAHHFPEGWFTAVADRLIRLEDRDGNGAADHRSLFSDRFHEPLDGIGFSVLAEDDGVYFTCIPKVWKLTDANDDGIADTHETVAEGFGVAVSFIGHDLHGIVRGPDGKLYFSIGDRGYNVTTKEGKVLAEAGRGAIFRCESDGSDFEVFCRGLRNPQEIAFDEHGNLFTFDNTGDIGDVARMVYALEDSDSGWNMAHQSAHHYRHALDWGDFHPPKSMWVAEHMFETYRDDQPQWVYPPASHVTRGPSGVAWLTGKAIPEDLRGRFLVANYRGAAANCTVLKITIEPKGAGYVAHPEEILVQGVGTTDVDQGYDGQIYLCDFGGGWTVNNNGAIHTLSPTTPAQQKEVARTRAIFAKGVAGTSLDELRKLLHESDRRMRQMAQFELVKRGARQALAEIANGDGAVTTRLHGIWGLGQLKAFDALVALTADPEAEIRANAARTLGSIRATVARRALIDLVGDDSPRVRSLAVIALGRIAKPNDYEVLNALRVVAARNSANPDLVVRHACLSAFSRLADVRFLVRQVSAPEREVRLIALLALRRKGAPALAAFLRGQEPLLRHEAIRAIYDTSALDTPAGDMLTQIDPKGLTETLQLRVAAACYRRGSARKLLHLAGNPAVEESVREYALQGLRMWEAHIDTDPVLGHYRPQARVKQSMAQLGTIIADDLRSFLATAQPPTLTALAMKLAADAGVSIDEATLRRQATNAELTAEVRVAALDSLAAKSKPLLAYLQKDADPLVQAAAMRQGFAVNLQGIHQTAREAVKNGPIPAARAGIAGLGPKAIAQLWQQRANLRAELKLDVYLALPAEQQDAAVARRFTTAGGDIALGKDIFENKGACLQCHKIRHNGGIQGPDLTTVASRLQPAKLLESLVDPNAEIADGYGNSTVTRKDGSVIVGRIAKETDAQLSVVTLDGSTHELARNDVTSVTPPISAMPPMALALPPRDLRDLIGYLASRTNQTRWLEDGWGMMFDGKTLNAWLGNGWRVEGGNLVADSADALLNFAGYSGPMELKFDFRITGGPPRIPLSIGETKALDVAADALKPQGFNTAYIVANGKTLVYKMNFAEIATLDGKSGQVRLHGVPNGKVEFRNIRLRPIAAEGH